MGILLLLLLLLPVACALWPFPRHRRREGTATLLPQWVSEHVYAYNTFPVSANVIVAFFCFRLPPHDTRRHDTPTNRHFMATNLVAVVTPRFIIQV